MNEAKNSISPFYSRETELDDVQAKEIGDKIFEDFNREGYSPDDIKAIVSSLLARSHSEIKREMISLSRKHAHAAREHEAFSEYLKSVNAIVDQEAEDLIDEVPQKASITHH